MKVKWQTVLSDRDFLMFTRILHCFALYNCKVMLACLLLNAFAAIQSATWQETQEIIKENRSFVLAVSSDTYDFSYILKIFVNAVHQSQIDANFVILDVFKENLTASDLNVPSFPAVISYYRGKSFATSKGPLDVEVILDFLSSHAFEDIPRLETEEDLQSFLDTAAMGLICAFDNASDETLPLLSDIHQNHFREINIAYCNPRLVPEEGFYVYRFIDNGFVKVNGTLFNATEADFEELLSSYTVPDVFKHEVRLVSFLEHENTTFIDLVFDTGSNFYLTPSQLELSRAVKKYCGMNVSYETLNFHYVSKNRYGFPEVVEQEQMRIIDLASPRHLKYMLDGELNLENAKEMCDNFKKGTLAPWWKSEPIPTEQGDDLDSVVALNVGSFVESGFSVIGFYWADDGCLRHLVAAKGELQKRAQLPIKFAEYSLANNDWPLEELDFDRLPRLVIFKDGKVLTNEKVGDTPEAVIDQILTQVTSQEL